MASVHPIICSVTTLFVAFLVWVVRAARRNHSIDARYGLQFGGGANAHIDLKYQVGPQIAWLYCERLTGASDFGLHAQDLCWSSPEIRAFTPSERQDFLVALKAWTDAGSVKFQIHARELENE
jgi:hypothetical protein